MSRRRASISCLALLRILLGSCAIAFLISAPAASQTSSGTILGTVRDSSGSVLPGVTVRVVNVGTNVTRDLVTSDVGDYEAPLLPPGEYRVEAELTDFKTAVREGIHLLVNQRAQVDLTMEVGTISEQVVVRADAPFVDTQSAAVGTVVDNKKIVELPLNGRDFFQLSTLVPGAVPPAEGSQNATQGGAVSVNGAREQSNNFLLDGIDNNDLAINQIVIPPSVDAVEEFKVQSSTYSAEFGRNGGGQFNYVTKSGTNTWRFAGYEFLRNAALDAKNFFDDENRDIPQFQRNLFGGTVGGPIQRDKLFFFGNYEGTRIRQAFTRIATVPPTAWVNGDFSSLLTGEIEPTTGLDTGQLFDPRTGLPIPGNVIPPSLMDSAGAEIAKFYPAPDDASATEPSGATVAPIGRNDINQFTIKVDQNAGTKGNIFYRYSLWDEDRFNAFDPLSDPTNVPGFGSSTLNRGQSLAIGWTVPIGNTALNDFRFGFNRLSGGIFQEHQGDDVSSALGITGLLTDPKDVGRPGVTLGITDALIEATNLPQERKDNTYQFIDTFTWIHGKHSLKAGVDVRRFQLNFFLDIIARGNFIFTGALSGVPFGNPIAELLMGSPTVALRQDPTKNTNTNIRSTAVNGYVQDDWKIADDVTLNLGLRYDFNQPPYDTEDRFSVPDFDSPDGGFIPVGTQGIPRAGFKADKNNFAPRIGIAWRPFHDAKTVVRGGYGVFYDSGILNLNLLPRLNPPNFALDLVVPAPSLKDAFSGDAFPVTLLNGIDASYHDGYYQQYSVGVQRELIPNLMLDVAYVGARGRDLQVFRDTNQGPPGGGEPFVLDPNFGPAQIAFAQGRSDYHSVQVRLERRFVNGLSVLSAYTWSRSRDNASALFGSHASSGAPQNSFDLDAEYGPSDFDAPNRWVLSYVWELPVGKGRRFLDRDDVLAAIFGNWEFAGIISLQSARPFTVSYGTAANFSGTDNGSNGGIGFDRPNQTGNPEISNPGPDGWFDPNAFTPPDNTFGTVGRNTLRGDTFNNVDLAFYKNIGVGDRGRVQVRIEVFNAFNNTFFFLPVADLTNANAGKPVHAADARQVQLGLKINF